MTTDGHDLDGTSPDDTTVDRAPTQTEATVLRMWTDLGLHPTSLDEDFFDLGGQSLTLVRFLAAVQEHVGVELPVDELFAEDLTIRAVAAAIQRAELARTDDATLAAVLAELDQLSDEEIALLVAEQS